MKRLRVTTTDGDQSTVKVYDNGVAFLCPDCEGPTSLKNSDETAFTLLCIDCMRTFLVTKNALKDVLGNEIEGKRVASARYD